MKKFIALLAAMTMCVTSISAIAAETQPSTTKTQELATQNDNTEDSEVVIIGSDGEVKAYRNFAQAISNFFFDISTGDTIKLLKNITVQGQQFSGYFIGLPENVTLDLNGHIIDFTSFYITTPSTITITDTSESNNGKIVANHKALDVKNYGNITLDNITIESKNAPVVSDSGSSVSYSTISVASGGKLNINNSTISGEFEAIDINGGDVTVSGNESLINVPESGEYGAIYIHNKGKLTVNGGTIQADNYNAIYGNGADPVGGTEIIVNSGSIIADGAGLYLPQKESKLTVNNGNITGSYVAVEVVSGTVDISGGTLTSTANEIDFRNDPNADGGQYCGAAIAAVGRSDVNGASGYAGNIDINISGGVFNGMQGLASVIQDTRDTNASITDINITDGTFNGTESAIYTDDNCKDIPVISGGTYSNDVSEYVDEGYGSVNDNGSFKIMKESVSATEEVMVTEDNKTAVENAMSDSGFANTDGTTYQLDTATVHGVTGSTVFVNYMFNDTTPYTLKFDTANIENADIKIGIVLYNIPENTTVSEPSVYIQ